MAFYVYIIQPEMDGSFYVGSCRIWMNGSSVAALLRWLFAVTAIPINAMRNELSPLQESRMLKRAISQGVDEKDLTTVLNVRVDRIRQTRDLAGNLIPKVQELMESNIIFRSTAEQLKRVIPTILSPSKRGFILKSKRGVRR